MSPENNGRQGPKKRKMKPKAVVFDHDDTIVGFLPTLCELHNLKYNTCLTDHDITSWDFDDLDITDARGVRVLGKELRETFAESENHGLYALLQPLDYAKYALDTIREIGYKIIILTARNEKFRETTANHALINGLVYDELHFSKDKVKTIKELSKQYNIVMFADDKGTTVQNVSENTRVKKVCLVNKAHNKNMDIDEEDIIRVNDLMDCVKELKEVNKKK